ncbi:MAG: cobalt-zinc-cadmium efflux system outer membrane protein [Myxococcota bacterium]|jgi:cobalt-zinc-cadmium efflux system outer membrane protein
MKYTTILICGIALATSCQSNSTDQITAHFTLPAPSVADALAMPDNLIVGNDLQSDWQQTYAAALAKNGDIIAAKARYSAALQQESIAGALPEPRLMLGGFIEPVETRNGPMQMKIGLQQRIPWQGRLDDLSAQQRIIAQAVAAEVVDKQLQIRRQLTELWAKRILLDRSVGITKTQVDLMHHIEDLVIAKFESGRASQAKVLRTQLATTKLEDRLFSLATAADLVDAKIFAASTVHGNTIDWSKQEYPLQDLMDSDFDNGPVRPRLLSLQFRMMAAAKSIDIANDRQMPDFTVGIDYTMVGDGNPGMATSGDDAFGVQLAFDIPFGNRPYAAMVAAAEQRQLSLRWQLEQATRNLDAEIVNALSLKDDAQRRVDLYRNKLIPRAESTIEATLQAFQSSQASLQDVLDASTLILEYQLQLEAAHSDMCSARAIIAGAILINNN